MGVAVLLGQLVAMLVVLPELGRLLGWRRRLASPITADEESCMSLIYAESAARPSSAPCRPTEDGAQPARPRPGGGQGVRVALLCVLTVAAVALYLVRLHSVDLDAMTGLGLISVLPVSTLIGLGLLTVGYIGALSLPRPCVWLLCVQLVLLVFMLHGITMLLESQPRFPISWVHAGFVEYIDRTGTTAPGLDTRWSWPGFFGLAAFWVGSGDMTALHTILTVTPLVHNLLYLVALGLLMSTLRMSWQAKWLAALFFCLLNWVGQDYFAPQGWTLLLYLLFVGFLVMWFRTPHRTWGKFRGRCAEEAGCGGGYGAMHHGGSCRPGRPGRRNGLCCLQSWWACSPRPPSATS